MKNFIILSIMIILAQSSFAQIVTNSGLERLERKLFNDTYRNENIDTRLNRLEVKMFGAEQTGTLDERYMTTATATILLPIMTQAIQSRLQTVRAGQQRVRAPM